MMRPSVAGPTGTEIPRAGVDHLHAALQTVRRAEADRAHDAVAELLLRLRASELAVCRKRQRIVDACGSASRGNSTSITAPMHWTIVP